MRSSRKRADYLSLTTGLHLRQSSHARHRRGTCDRRNRHGATPGSELVIARTTVANAAGRRSKGGPPQPLGGQSRIAGLRLVDKKLRLQSQSETLSHRRLDLHFQIIVST